MIEITQTPHYYEVKLSEDPDRVRIARKSKGGDDIMLYCAYTQGSEFFNYIKREGDWVIANERKGLRQFEVKRRYVPGTLEHQAFEQLSGVKLEVLC